MQAITPEGQKTSLTSDESIEQAIDSLVDAVDAPESALSPFIELVEGVAHQLEETAQDAAQARERAHEAEERVEELEGELKEEREARTREAAEDRKRLTSIEEEVEDHLSDHDPHTPEGENTTADASHTPIEQLSQADDVEDVTDSPSVERAVSLFENLPKWGSKTPKGIVLKPADNPLSLLEADRNESLAWKQYYRAAEALERLSKGAVTFFDSDRHGKMLVLHEQSEVYDRVRNGSLSPSSVEGEA